MNTSDRGSRNELGFSLLVFGATGALLHVFRQGVFVDSGFSLLYAALPERRDAANGGTLFLDELGELHAQIKLLRMRT